MKIRRSKTKPVIKSVSRQVLASDFKKKRYKTIESNLESCK